jgi:hypothetical protein
LAGKRPQQLGPDVTDFDPYHPVACGRSRALVLFFNFREVQSVKSASQIRPQDQQHVEAASSFSLLPGIIEKDYVLGWILGAINALAEIAESWDSAPVAVLGRDTNASRLQNTGRRRGYRDAELQSCRPRPCTARDMPMP